MNFWLRDSSAVEQEAVNFKVRGSNPRRGAKNLYSAIVRQLADRKLLTSRSEVRILVAEQQKKIKHFAWLFCYFSGRCSALAESRSEHSERRSS